ncbi:MAG: galactose mutarotase [Calditrichaceae bacterium]|jgi:aldose 1-epimerase
MNIKLFGKSKDNRDVFLFELANKNGMRVEVMNYGATVVKIIVPGRNGKAEDVVLGYDRLEDYLNDTVYFGCIVGRYGNRIAKGKFKLKDKVYKLAQNNGENHLHGGIEGFNRKVWNVIESINVFIETITFVYKSPDGEEGYPGNVTLEVTYTVTDDNELKIEYLGKTDKTTILNPTNHSYFNLTGNFNQTILEHKLEMDAAHYTPTDSGSIPTGEIADVQGTPMDFQKAIPLGKHIDDSFEQLKFAGGYDHNWVFNDFDGQVKHRATLHDPKSGRVIDLFTSEPGVQMYTGNYLDNIENGKNGITYKQRTGVCLETQHFPDSPNHDNFPSVVLKPGEEYRQTTIYKFSIK